MGIGMDGDAGIGNCGEADITLEEEDRALGGSFVTVTLKCQNEPVKTNCQNVKKRAALRVFDILTVSF